MKELICLATILTNLSGLDWNTHDLKMKEYAKNVCSTREQYKDTPCLKEFIKTGKRSYQAICSTQTQKQGERDE